MVLRCKQCEKEYPLTNVSDIPKEVAYIAVSYCIACPENGEYKEEYVYKQKKDKPTYVVNDDQVELF